MLLGIVLAFLAREVVPRMNNEIVNASEWDVMGGVVTSMDCQEHLLVVVQGAYSWNAADETTPFPLPSTVWNTSDPDLLVPWKENVDVIVKSFPEWCDESGKRQKITLRVGDRIHKTIRQPNHHMDAAIHAACAVNAADTFGQLPPWHLDRVRWAGTYNDLWRTQRSPLLPRDFNPRFYNCAPLDQQLPDYPAGERVSLHGVGTPYVSAFMVPAFCVAITCVTDEGSVTKKYVTADTIEICFAERCVVLRGRMTHALYQPEVGTLHDVVVGDVPARLLNRWATRRDCTRTVHRDPHRYGNEHKSRGVVS